AREDAAPITRTQGVYACTGTTLAKKPRDSQRSASHDRPVCSCLPVNPLRSAAAFTRPVPRRGRGRHVLRAPVVPQRPPPFRPAPQSRGAGWSRGRAGRVSRYDDDGGGRSQAVGAALEGLIRFGTPALTVYVPASVGLEGAFTSDYFSPQYRDIQSGVYPCYTPAVQQRAPVRRVQGLRLSLGTDFLGFRATTGLIAALAVVGVDLVRTRVFTIRAVPQAGLVHFVEGREIAQPDLLGQ